MGKIKFSYGLTTAQVEKLKSMYSNYKITTPIYIFCTLHRCFKKRCWDERAGGAFSESFYISFLTFHYICLKELFVFLIISGEDMPFTVVTLPRPLLLMKRNLRDGELRVVIGQ